MAEVFLLGAGFSKAVSGEMPVLTELSRLVEDRIPGSLPAPLARLGNNLELWLSYLSEPQPWLRESDNLRNRATALDLTHVLTEVLAERQLLAIETDMPCWLQKLTKVWHETKAGVISLNYDSLVERAARRIRTDTRDSSGLSVGELYPVQLTNALRRDEAVLGSGSQDTFTLCKLHGSTNWYYSGSAEFTGEVIYYTYVAPWGEPDPRGDDSTESEQEAVSDKVPLIVPPTTEKMRFLQHESVKRTWARASELLAEATTLIVIGYSLPPTDLAIRFLLHAARRHPKLYIVNSDCEVAHRYRELLGQAFVINEEYLGENAVERFVAERY